MKNYLTSLDKMASKNWRIRFFPNDHSKFFVEADKLKPDHAYDINVGHEDMHPKLYPEKVAKADMQLMVALRNNLPEILQLLEMSHVPHRLAHVGVYPDACALLVPVPRFGEVVCRSYLKTGLTASNRRALSTYGTV